MKLKGGNNTMLERSWKERCQEMRLKEKSRSIDKYNWYYEEPKGISFVHEVYRHGTYLQTDIVLIPWKKLLESTRRKFAGRNI